MEFNPVEIFKIAQKLEENGISFYKKSAEIAKDENLKSVLLDISIMESTHLDFFKKMENNVKSSDFIDSNDIGEYLERIFGAKIFQKDPALKIGKELLNMSDIFQFALERENESVEFYSNILKNIKNPETSRSLEIIIGEEKVHANLMKEYLKTSN